MLKAAKPVVLPLAVVSPEVPWQEEVLVSADPLEPLAERELEGPSMVLQAERKVGEWLVVQLEERMLEECPEECLEVQPAE